jgi:hypothetical protein
MTDTSNRGEAIFDKEDQRFPAPGQPIIDMRGFNAIEFKGQMENAIITIHFEAKQSIKKIIPTIGATNKVNDTFPFPLGDNSGKIEFSFQKIDSSKPSPCEIKYELTILNDEEFESQSKRVFQF